MADDPQPMTLQQRVAALNAAHLGRVPGESHASNLGLPPQVPERRPVLKQDSFKPPNANVVSTTRQPRYAKPSNNPPPLPDRKKPPPLPARKSSQGEEVGVSIVSHANKYDEPRVSATRTKSEPNGSRIKAPAWGDCELPPLPLKVEPKTRKTSFPERPQLSQRTSSVSTIASSVTSFSNSSRQSLPSLAGRKASTDNVLRRVPPIPSEETLEKARKASFASSNDGAVPVTSNPPLPTRRPSVAPIEKLKDSLETMSVASKPPPVPKMSKPDLSALQVTKPKMRNHQLPSAPLSICMTCRDFSGPDRHATLFPRQNVTSLQTLAQQLTGPFTSPTDKARAIFTWLHHNIDYNVKDFFSGNLKSSTPQSTLQTGLAVCEGYAALFTNIATHAGLESMVVSGHGKGFGFHALTPGAPLPRYDGNHAWNVVKIDNAEWKLIDSCWGAGHVQGAGMPYNRKFSPERFTQSNEEFGVDHFPNDQNHFFLPGGRTLSWAEYIQINPAFWPYAFERPTYFGNAETDYSIGKQTIIPPNRQVSVHQQGTLRFQFGLFCPHWSLENHTQKGPPPVFILAVGGVDGRNKHYLPFEHIRNGSDGEMWVIDVPARELGAPGETLTLLAVRSFGNRQDARGLTVREFNAGIGRTNMGFVGVAAWDLV